MAATPDESTPDRGEVDDEHLPQLAPDPFAGRTTPPWAWRFLVGTVVNVLRLFGWRFRAHVEGEIPPIGTPMVVAVNHTGQLEPFLVAHAVWKRTGHWVRPLAKAELFDVPVLGFLGRRAGAIPVFRDSEAGRRGAYDAALEVLGSGGAIYIAPEGTITHDGELLPLRHGAARLAMQADVPVLVVTSFGGQRAFSPVVKRIDRNALFDVHMEVLPAQADEEPADLTGRIAAVMLDRSTQLREAHPEQAPGAPWWPPYPEPGEPSRTAAENLAAYRDAMSEAIEQARERMAAAAAERELDERVRTARQRARAAAEQARHRATELGDQLRHRADELVELARHGELGDQVRHRAEELSASARQLAEQLAALREQASADREPHAAEPADTAAATPTEDAVDDTTDPADRAAG